MVWIRSFLFNICFLMIWTPFVCIVGMPFLLLPVRHSILVGRVWAYGTLFLARVICGIRHEVKGRENIPESTCIIASKHQSAWDTVVFFSIFDRPCYVLKYELRKIPLLGMHLMRMGMIDVNRKEGTKSLKQMIVRAKVRIDEGRPIVIFPEGTRACAHTEKTVLQPGVAALYNDKNITIPVLPVALNSGTLWGRDSFLKRPGTITIEFLPPIPSGLPRKVFMQQLEQQIHDASKRLVEQQTSKQA